MDPYQVLGVSRSSTDEEIKSQYRKLSKIYHPDMNVGKPNEKECEEKFKQIQQAYSTIMDERQGKSYSSFNAQYNTNDSYESQDETYIKSAINYMNNGYFKEGLNVLNQVKVRKASWYYYSAYGNYRIGNNVLAKQQIDIATKMEPNNAYYMALKNQINGVGFNYTSRSTSYGNPTQTGFTISPLRRICYAVICSSMLCGGGRFLCYPILCC